MSLEFWLALWCGVGFFVNCALSFALNKKLTVLDVCLQLLSCVAWPVMVGAFAVLRMSNSDFWNRRIL